MILGVDHLALSCADAVDAAARLGAWGFRTAFIARGLPNPPAKRPFLRRYEPGHDIAYCRPDQGVALELTQHAAPAPDADAPYQLLLAGPCPAGAAFPEGEASGWPAALRSAGLAARPELVRWEGPAAPVWYEPAPPGTDLAVRAVLLPVLDLDQSERFWVEGLGARRQARPAGTGPGAWCHLAFARPVRAWALDLLLGVAGGPPARAPLLDDPGFPCLALLSTRLEEDVEKACAHGGRSASPAFGLAVAGRFLKIALLRGPAGEVVELIEVRRPQP